MPRLSRAACAAVRRPLGTQTKGKGNTMPITDTDGLAYGPINTGQQPGALRELLSRPAPTPQVPALAGMSPLGLPSRKANVCDSCLTAAYDEGASGRDDQRILCMGMGADIADHLCDAREEPDLGPCSCACN